MEFQLIYDNGSSGRFFMCFQVDLRIIGNQMEGAPFCSEPYDMVRVRILFFSNVLFSFSVDLGR